MPGYTPPYIPRADGLFRGFAETFATGITKNPSRYGLAEAEAATVMRSFQVFNAAYSIAIDPETRTRGTIAAKDDARSILKNQIQVYAANLRANLGITDQDKINIGLRPATDSHKERKCPHTSPLLNFIASAPGQHELTYHDNTTPDSKAKPRGADRLELWVAYSAPHAGQPQPRKEDAQFIGSFKKNRFIVEPDPEMEAAGLRPTYWARWAGFNGDVGPWSLPVSLASAAEAARKERQAKKQGEAEDADQSLKIAA